MIDKITAMSNTSFDPSNEWLEDPNLTDADKLAYFDSLPDAEIYIPEGMALRHLIKFQLLKNGITPDASHNDDWLNDDSVSDEEKRTWLAEILSQSA